jgi:hypothetical protein
VYTSDATAKTVGSIDLSVSKVITVRAYATAAGQSVRLKVEDAGNNAIYLEVDATTTKANAWETLSFNLAAPVNGVYNAANTYNRISLFPLFSTTAPPAADTTLYFDELKFTLAAGGGTGGGTGSGTLTGGVFANDYVGTLPATSKSVQGGDVGFFFDQRLFDTKAYDYGGLSGTAQNPGGVPNFYYGLGLSAPALTNAYFGAYVKSPGNAVVDVSGYTNLRVNVWGNDELFRAGTFPALNVVLQGPAVVGCGSSSGASEVQTTFNTTTQGAASNYTLPLSAFTLKFACSGETTAAQVLSKVAQFNVQILNTNIQYTNKDGGGVGFTNGLNVGTIAFN